MSHAATPRSTTDAASPISADRAARDILTASTGVAEAARRARQAVEALDPWRPPARDAALLLSSLAAVAPGAISVEIGAALAGVVRRGDLSQTWQPGLDEAFQLLPLLIPTPAGELLSGLLAEILSTDARHGHTNGPMHVHERWASKALDLWVDIAFWRPELLDIDETLAAAGRCPPAGRRRLFRDVIVPLLLADPASIDLDRFQRACAVPAEMIEARYLATALVSHPDTPAETRCRAAELAAGWFPLRAVWQRIFGQRGLQVLCVQNIADAQGDEIVRTVPLLQALLDQHPDTRITLITDRAYLYSHARIQTHSFDDQDGRERALRMRPDILIEFHEANVPFLNYDADLSAALAQLREVQQPPLDIQAGKGWNYFVLSRVLFGGLDWARALVLDRLHSASVYDPALRLIMELGLPLRIGEQAPYAGSVLASQPWAAAAEAWRDITKHNHAGRPVALVNPFGGADPRKGFVPRKYADLARLITALVGEGYFVVLCPNGTAWGSTPAVADLRSLLPEQARARVVVAPDPAAQQTMVPLDDEAASTVPYASAIMRQYMRFVAWADLVVTVEGWMAHAAYLLGKPYRLLMLPDSQGPAWQPWGRSRDQRVWLFSGDPALDRPPLPEKPRKSAWLQLLNRVAETGWLELLGEISQTEDRAVRVAAAQALGRLGTSAALPHLLRLLRDPSNGVRAAAADALLTHYHGQLGQGELPDAETLEVTRLIVDLAPHQRDILRYGERAVGPLTRALTGDDPVIRRDAAALLEGISREQSLRRGAKGVAAALTPGPSPNAGRGGKRTTNGVTSWFLPSPVRGGAGGEVGEAAASPAAPDEGQRQPSVLILTPLKDSADCIERYCLMLRSLSYPRQRLSLGFLESDSRDGTYAAMRAVLPSLERDFSRAELWKRDFGYTVPAGVHRGAHAIQRERRGVLARSRNHLLMHALRDEDWVLWLDVDVIWYPPDIIERLLATGRRIVQPHCVLDYGGATFDQNAWRDKGRLHLDDLRDEGDLVPLDTVGGTMLLIRADLHRDGLIFPAVPYRPGHPKARREEGELETEGLGILAGDLGETCWGMPNLEIIHRRA